MNADTRIELKASRGVLQVVGCDDAIAATVGMPLGSFSVLTED